MEAEKKVESPLDGSVARTFSDPIVVEGKGLMETAVFLEERFGSDASFGVRHIDMDTGQEVSVDDLLSYEGDTESVFPDGSITDCANYAIQVRNAMPAGSVRVVGFRKEENPDSDVARESWNLLQLEGPREHVFAIVGDRYLVDPWAKLFTGVRDRVAYDLQDDQDALLVAQTYGSPGNWSELPETGIWRERTSQWDRKGLEKVTAKIWSLIWPMYQNKSTKRVEYVVVNENLLGYRAPGATMVQALSAPGRDPRNTQYPVQLTVDAVRPATAADFAQYRVSVNGYEADLSKPLIPVLEHHLTENVPLDRLDSEAVARELRERTLEYAWATRKTPEALLRMADDMISGEQLPEIAATSLQQAMLRKIARSEYTSINGAMPQSAGDTETWADTIIETAEDKGVFTSLKNAGLVWHSGEKTDAGVGLTDKGFVLYQGIEERLTKRLDDSVRARNEVEDTTDALPNEEAARSDGLDAPLHKRGLASSVMKNL
ncbi:MAG: hypothetical protein ACYCQL_00670 [Acidithiobacillus sp.]